MQAIDPQLTGKLLIAMPDMGDPRFALSVIYMCAHSEEGAMGLIVNKPAHDVSFRNLLKQLKIKPEPGLTDIGVQFGGPVENGRGFVLHTADYRSEIGTMDVDGQIGMTSTMDVLEDIAKGHGPATAMLALGYAGWGAGQLEREIAQNGWLSCDASQEIIFGADHDRKWTAALATLGIDPMLLSSTAGHA